MIPTAYQNYMFNENDYFPQDYHVDDPEKLELLKKLVAMISDDLELSGKPDNVTESTPDLWLLDTLLTKEEVTFMLTFKKKRSVKRTVAQIVKKTGMTVDAVNTMVAHICEIGLLEFDRENAKHERQYFIPKFVIGSGEYMLMNGRLMEEHPEIATFFNYATSVPVGKTAHMVPPGGGGIGMHVIPIEKAIEHENKAVSLEKISHWLKKYDKYAVDVCACRRQRRISGEGAGDVEDYFCVALGDMAEYVVETKKDAHYVTYDEVIKLLENAEKKGYVHQITNLDGADKVVMICNCSITSCNALRTSQLFNTPNLSASAYRAHVDYKKCVACGKCVEVCPVGAAKLGQKLCKQDGSKVSYPKTELPDAVKWGPEKWNKHYREDAKINCYDTGTAPCKTACPAHLAVQGYLKMAAEGRYLDALKLIKQDNPFPAVCGAICNHRCENRCTRGTIDQPVAIDEVKKFIAAQELCAETRFVPECSNEIGSMWGPDFKMAVIGAGAAGMSAAYFLRRRGYDVTVFEKEKRPGGMMMNAIPNFRLEKDVVDAEIDVLRQMGVEFRCGIEVGKDVTISDLRKQGYKAFYVAIGLQSGGKLRIPGEDAEGVMAGIDFVKEVNLEGRQKLTGNVVVIGGGNIGADIARTAVRCGADSVSLYCLEAYDEMPMGVDDRTECEQEGIVIHAGWGQTEIVTKDGKCAGIKFRKCLSVKNAEGRFAPTFDDNLTEEAACTTVLYCIGQKVDWKTLLDGTKVEFNPNGTAKAHPITLQTAEPDIFVSGDALTGQKFVIDAIAVGKQAAESMHRIVHPGQGDLMIGRDTREFIELDRDDISIESYDNTPRQIPSMKSGDSAKTFDDLRETLTEQQVQAEAQRCLKCGATTVDVNRCIGCGLCTTRCEFDAIQLRRDMPQNTKMYTGEENKLKAILPYVIKRNIKIRRNENSNNKK